MIISFSTIEKGTRSFKLFDSWLFNQQFISLAKEGMPSKAYSNSLQAIKEVLNTDSSVHAFHSALSRILPGSREDGCISVNGLFCWMPTDMEGKGRLILWQQECGYLNLQNCVFLWRLR